MSVITGDPLLNELIGFIPGFSQLQEVLFWMQQVSKLIGDFLQLFRNEDDKVAEVYLAWNVAALDDLLASNAKNGIGVEFNGGSGGHHRLCGSVVFVNTTISQTKS